MKTSRENQHASNGRNGNAGHGRKVLILSLEVSTGKETRVNRSHMLALYSERYSSPQACVSGSGSADCVLELSNKGNKCRLVGAVWYLWGLTEAKRKRTD